MNEKKYVKSNGRKNTNTVIGELHDVHRWFVDEYYMERKKLNYNPSIPYIRIKLVFKVTENFEIKVYINNFLEHFRQL